MIEHQVSDHDMDFVDILPCGVTPTVVEGVTR